MKFIENVFNPAMVGRCFLYICFPVTMAASWFVPFQGGIAGFARYTPDINTMRTADIDSSMFNIDGVTSATTLSATKKLGQFYRSAVAKGKEVDQQKALDSYKSVSLAKLFMGNINGSVGETSALLILIALAYLIYNKVLFIPLVVGPIIGLFIGKLLLLGLGYEPFPFLHSFLVNIFAGGTFFAATFMITEPITAPMNKKARWTYAILIGFLAAIIRSLSTFNAGFMFAILLGNTFGPLIEIGFTEWDNRAKVKKA